MFTKTSVADVFPQKLAIREYCGEERTEVAWHAAPEHTTPLASWYLPVKFGIEWVLALALLIITAPLIVVFGLLVKATSRGPAFFAQTRLGKFGRIYRMYKLRTMVQNAEAGTGPVWAKENDSRITPVGKFLRLTHLDELPQLWNVLRGEMSLIGPRPERPEIARRIERHVPNFHLRLQVRPGITGLAQMLLPADNPDDDKMECVKKKLAYDLYYIRHIGLLVDLRIAFCTPCYFLAAAVDAIRLSLVKGYGKAIDVQLATAGEVEFEIKPSGRSVEKISRSGKAL